MLLARPPEDYEDLLQESLLKAFNGFDTFVRDLPFKAWYSPSSEIPISTGSGAGRRRPSRIR